MSHVALIPQHACGEAVNWVEGQSGTPHELWMRCDRGDWLLWLATRLGVERRLFVLAACACAELVVHLAEPDSQLALVWAIDSARRLVGLGEAYRAALTDLMGWLDDREVPF